MLTSRQALFTAQLGGPHLEHSLSFQALRLAFLGKLNWDVDIEVPLPTSGGNSHRNLLFWATYCLEKQESNQSGVLQVRCPCGFPRLCWPYYGAGGLTNYSS